MQLLNSIIEQSVDPDYSQVANQNRSRRATTSFSSFVAVLAVMVLTGMLIYAYAAYDVSRAPDAAEERAELISRVDARSSERAEKSSEVNKLRAEIDQLQELALDGDSEQLALLKTLATYAGAQSMVGPGVVVDIADSTGQEAPSIIDQDLRKLVNGLWQAGAEGVAVNGLRITSLTAIREGGLAITVNYTSISPPYRVEAIGDPDRLPGAFAQTSAASWWDSLTNRYGISYSITPVKELQLPAESRLDVRHASPAPR